MVSDPGLTLPSGGALRPSSPRGVRRHIRCRSLGQPGTEVPRTRSFEALRRSGSGPRRDTEPSGLSSICGSSCAQTPFPARQSWVGDVTRPPETSEGCEAHGNRSEGQSLALGRAGVPEQPRAAVPAPLPAEPSRAEPRPPGLPAPRRCGLAGLLRGGEETKIKKRWQKRALGNE